MKEGLASSRLVFLFITACVSLWAAVELGDEFRLSEKPSEYIGVTFSILAASLFAVVSIIGDPSMLLSGSWRSAWESAKEIQARLQRLNILFICYLITLTLLIISELIEYMNLEELYFIHNIFVFFAVFGLVTSFALPFELVSIQKERLEHEILARKKRLKSEK